MLLNMRNLIAISTLALALAVSAQAGDLRVPAEVPAGSGFTISADMNGEPTFYLIGPATVVKRTAQRWKRNPSPRR